MDEILNSLPAFLFWIIAGFTALCAVAVVVSQSIVRSATWLLFTLAGASGIFFLLGADFVAATQLLVYVGGTLVLVIFGVMLTAQGPFVTMKTSVAEWAISAVVGGLLLTALVVSIFAVEAPSSSGPASEFAQNQMLIHDGAGTAKHGADVGKKVAKGKEGANKDAIEHAEKGDDGAKNSEYADAIGLGFVGVPVGPAHRDGDQKTGPVVRMNYLLPFEIVSVHLLVVLIGAAYLARAKRRRRVEA